MAVAMCAFKTTHPARTVTNLGWVLTGRLTGTCWWRKGRLVRVALVGLQGLGVRLAVLVHRDPLVQQVLPARQVPRVLVDHQDLVVLPGQQERLDRQVHPGQVGHQDPRVRLAVLGPPGRAVRLARLEALVLQDRPDQQEQE